MNRQTISCPECDGTGYIKDKYDYCYFCEGYGILILENNKIRLIEKQDINLFENR